VGENKCSLRSEQEVKDPEEAKAIALFTPVIAIRVLA
jgi:hypothetical protein